MTKKYFLMMFALATLVSACSQDKNRTAPRAAFKPNAASGGVDGGGGKGIRCGSELATLDLFEARRNGLTPLNSFGSLNENVKKFGIEMAKHFTESLDGFDDPHLETEILKEMNDLIISRFKDIPAGERLPLTNDATIPELPANCQVVQIAVYAQDGTIYRDSEYWSQLNDVEQAALILHELVYHHAREYGALNSDESRRVLGLIFSGRNPEPLLSPWWQEQKRFWCGAGRQGSAQEVYEIYGKAESQDGVSGVALYFRALKSTYLTSRTVAFLPGITLEDFMQGRFPSFSVTAENALMARSWIFEIAPEASRSGYVLRAFEQGATPPPLSHGFCKWE